MAIIVPSMLGTLYSQQPKQLYQLSLESICAYIYVFSKNQQMASVFPVARPQGNFNDIELVFSIL